jgi:hypothetical protein
MNADKWCPGDMYIQLGAIPDFSSYDNIEILNELFLSGTGDQQWGSKSKPLVAVSLKQEKAQGGKAKGLLQKFTKVKTDYNLTKDEIDLDEDSLRKRIQDLRNKVSKLVGGAEHIVYSIDNPSVNDIDSGKLKGKYAALKAIEFLFRKFPSKKVDDAVVALAGFALSLTKVNPGFFKIIGQSSGSNAKVESFPRGTNVVLYNRGGEYSDITIRDSVEAGAIQIKFTILKQGEPYSVQISARNNGNLQGTLEIEKFDQIN